MCVNKYVLYVYIIYAYIIQLCTHCYLMHNFAITPYLKAIFIYLNLYIYFFISYLTLSDM